MAPSGTGLGPVNFLSFYSGHLQRKLLVEWILMGMQQLNYLASSEVHDLIATIGRTEDIKLSPDNRRLAIAEFSQNTILLFSISIGHEAEIPSIDLKNYIRFSSQSLRAPHGLSFLDNEHLIVANREGWINIFHIPAGSENNTGCNLDPVGTIRGDDAKAKVKSPGSIDCYEISPHRYLLLVCNNYVHYITSHIIECDGDVLIQYDQIVVQEGLDIPDGVSISPDRTWVAVSNHMTGSVLMYRMGLAENEHLEQVGQLIGMVCPHGIRFSSDGQRIFVADAASPYMHVYENFSGDWGGSRNPVNSIKMLNDAVFQIGRTNPLEGGLKGIDINNEDSVLLTTTEAEVLAFYDLKRLLTVTGSCIKTEIATLCRERDEQHQIFLSGVCNPPWWSLSRLKKRFLA